LMSRNLLQYGQADTNFARYDAARTLDALGHIEVDFDSSSPRLHAAPSALSLLPNSGLPAAVLSGARGPSTVTAIAAEIDKYGSTMHIDIRQQRSESSCLPARVMVTADSHEDLALMAAAAQLVFQRVPISWTLLNFAGTLVDYISECQWMRADELNWEQRQFDPQILHFSANPSDGELRLIKYTHPSRQYPIHYLWRQTEAARVNPDWGRFAVLRTAGRDVVQYDHSASAVVVPATVPLPKLLARALCLCSGLAPQDVAGDRMVASAINAPFFKIYRRVPYEFARLLAMKLDQILITRFTICNLSND